jgi:hypothetical protein
MACALREPDGFRYAAQVVVHDHDVGGLHRRVVPMPPIAKPMLAVASAGVVDAVPDHGHGGS